MKRFSISIWFLCVFAFCIGVQGTVAFDGTPWYAVDCDDSDEIEAAFVKTRFVENFDAELDFDTKWDLCEQGYEWRSYPDAKVSGSFGVVDGQLRMTDMKALVSYWGGRSIITKESFSASGDSVLSVSVDRPYMIKYSGEAVCNNLVLRNKDGSVFVAFRDDQGEGGWMVNTVIGVSGTVLAESGGHSHRMKMEYDGSVVSFFIDGKQIGSVGWTCNDPLYVELGFYAREAADNVSGASMAASGEGAYDNLVIENISNNATLSGSTLAVMPGFSNFVDVMLPDRLVAEKDVTVFASVVNPTVAYLEGAAEGFSEIKFEKGGPSTRRINVVGTGVRGATKIYFSSEDVEFERILNVQGYEAPDLLFSDSLATADPALWKVTGIEVAREKVATCLAMTSTYLATVDHPVVLEYEQHSVKDLVSGLNALALLFDLPSENNSFGLAYGYAGCSGWGICSPDLSESAEINALEDDEFQFDTVDTHKVRLVCDGNYVTVYVDNYRAGRYAHVSRNPSFALSLIGKSVAEEKDILRSFSNIKVYGVSVIDVDTDNLLLNIGEIAAFTIKVPDSIRKLSPTVTLAIDNPSRVAFVGGTSTISCQLTDDVVVEVVGQKIGSASILLENNLGLEMAISEISVVISDGSEVLLLDNLNGVDSQMDLSKWYINEKGYEYSQYPNAGGITKVSVENGYATMSLDLNAGQYWGGRAYITKDGFRASELSPLTFTVTRSSFISSGTGGRCAFLVYRGTGSGRWIHIADMEDTKYYGWVVNKNTGDSSDISSGVGNPFPNLNNGVLNDRKEHEVKLVANGKTVAVYVDDVYGGEVNFAVNEDIHFGIAVYARAVGDTTTSTFKGPIMVTGSRDPLPNPPVITKNPASASVVEGESVKLSGAAENAESYQWYKDGVAITGATHATYTISDVSIDDAGVYKFSAANRGGIVTSELAELSVIEKPKSIYMDQFTEESVKTNWTADDTGLETISYPNSAANSSVNFGNGLSVTVRAVSNYWPGRTYWLNRRFTASETIPLTITLNRNFYAGSGSGFRCAFCISSDSSDKWYKFAEAYDGESKAWGYNSHENPENTVKEMNALDKFVDKGNHDVKLVLNGKKLSFYVDDVLGGTFDYPVTENIRFGVSVFVRDVSDRANVRFKNLEIFGADDAIAAESDVEPSLTYFVLEGKIYLEFVGTLEWSPDGEEWFATDVISPYITEISECKNMFFRAVKE